jgi:hypothetical protein
MAAPGRAVWFYQPLLLLLASSTDSNLAKQVEYLKAENQILRRHLGKRPYLDEPDKRLLVKLRPKAPTQCGCMTEMY